MADAGLLSSDNLSDLQHDGYQYILGAGIKNESKDIKQSILKNKWYEGKAIQLTRQDKSRLIVTYLQKRARKDEHNRKRGISRLEKQVKSGKLTKLKVIENYNNLWHIEKAFRMSKTDLRIRPIYHRLKHRIEAHICIAFTAYSIYKELERILYKEKSSLSLNHAAELTHNMYEITYTLPESKHTKSRFLKMDAKQMELFEIINKNC